MTAVMHTPLAVRQPAAGKAVQRLGCTRAIHQQSHQTLPAQLTSTKLGWSEGFDVRWVRGRMLGKGNYGMIYEAIAVDQDDGDDATYAVKVLSKDGGNHKALNRIAREAAVLEQLRGVPGVLQLHEKYEGPYYASLVTELVPGGDLLTLKKALGGSLNELQLAFIAQQCLRVLASVHGAGLCHGDVKPSNWLTRAGTAHLLQALEQGRASPKQLCELWVYAIDFGSSSYVTPGMRLTRRTGTPVYQSPELLQRSYDTKADIWSLGMVLFQLFSKRLPYWPTLQAARSASMEEIQRHILQTPVVFTGDRFDGLSQQGRNFLATLLQRDPLLRPSAVEALQHVWLQQLQPQLALHRPAKKAECAPPADAAAHTQVASSNSVPGVAAVHNTDQLQLTSPVRVNTLATLGQMHAPDQVAIAVSPRAAGKGAVADRVPGLGTGSSGRAKRQTADHSQADKSFLQHPPPSGPSSAIAYALHRTAAAAPPAEGGRSAQPLPDTHINPKVATPVALTLPNPVADASPNISARKASRTLLTPQPAEPVTVGLRKPRAASSDLSHTTCASSTTQQGVKGDSPSKEQQELAVVEGKPTRRSLRHSKTTFRQMQMSWSWS